MATIKDGVLLEVSYNEITDVDWRYVVPNEVRVIGEKALACRSLESIILPEGLEKIEDHALMDNYLKEILIPESVEEIGNWALYGNRLTNICIPKKNKNIKRRVFGKK
ncbi:MAG TPA: leucine-rich repeat domain-containing protein [Bacilli bacterium]|nr:leucine-rich repeat domain-containing protein [Bacilli bacterium]